MNEKEYNQDVETSDHGENEDKQKEGDRYEKVCCMCRRPESKTSPMISMPDSVNLCRDCIQKAFDSVAKGGMGFSKLPSIPYMNTNLNNLSTTPPVVEIPKEQEIKKKAKRQPVLIMKDIPAPYVIKTRLDEYVIGQKKAEKVMAVAVYNHYKRTFLDHPSKGVAVEDARADKSIVIGKSNIPMISLTGSGKTYLVRALAKFLDVPLAIVDTASLTEAGYIGDDTESVVPKLLTAADNDVDRAQKGVIFIDEISEIAKKKQTSTKNVSGESIQQELLKLLEGSTAGVPVDSNQKNTMTPMATVNTDNIPFICDDAFPDLEEIIKERPMKKTTMGFGSILKGTYGKDPDILGQVTSEDLRTSGMALKFLRRSPVTVTLQGLAEDMMVRTLKEPRDAITKQYEQLLEMDEVWLIFEGEALKWIASEAIKRGTGVKALRTILGGFMLDIMYETPKGPSIGSVVVIRPYLEKSSGPLIQMRG